MRASSRATEMPALPRIKILFSYFYLRNGKDRAADLLAALSPYADILVDSGAFTDFQALKKAQAKGTSYTPVNVADYIAWLRDYGQYWWQYIALDVIRNPEESRKNLAAMAAAGLKPMPVFTYPENLEAVPDFVALNDHICVAGGVEASVPFMHQRFYRVYNASEGKAKIHGLGFVRYPDIYRLPLNSVDSSSWMGGMKFAALHRFDKKKGLVGGHWSDLLQKKRDVAAWRYLRDCGVTPEMLATRSKPYWDCNNSIIGLLTVNAHCQLARDSHAHGRKYFHAASLPVTLMSLFGVVAHQSKTADGAVDYKSACELALHLIRLWQADKEEGMKLCAEVLRDNTDWKQE